VVIHVQYVSWEKEIKQLEREIEKLESRQVEINEKISSEDFSAKPDDLKTLILEQSKNQETLDQKFSRWEEVGFLLNS
jgi:valyl-tRNA synthetase